MSGAAQPGRDRGPRAAEFEAAIRAGGVVLFPSDTVYGLACDPENAAAIDRLYALKARPGDRSAAIMFFDLRAALRALPELGQRTHTALHGLMPGPVTALVANPAGRFPLACRADPQTLGLRVVSVPPLAGVQVAVMQSSANPSGRAEAASLDTADAAIRAGVDLAIDGGELPGTPSTVVDLRAFEVDGSWTVVREGPLTRQRVGELLNNVYHFEPDTYDADVVAVVHDYEALQDAVAAASIHGGPVARILELGTGTGATAQRLLAAHLRASMVGVDGSPSMLAAAARALPSERFQARLAALEEPLPEGPFDLVASALTVHHLDDEAKAELFRRVRRVLGPGGRFVLADVVRPEDPSDAVIELEEGFDRPSGVEQQLAWLLRAGFSSASVAWQRQDLAVIIAG